MKRNRLLCVLVASTIALPSEAPGAAETTSPATTAAPEGATASVCLAVDFAEGPALRELIPLGSSPQPASSGTAFFRDPSEQLHWLTDGTLAGTRRIRLPCEHCVSTEFSTGWLHFEATSSSSVKVSDVSWSDAQGKVVPLRASDGRKLTLAISHALIAAGPNLFFEGCDAEAGCQIWAARTSDGLAVAAGDFSMSSARAVGSALLVEPFLGRHQLLRRGAAPLALTGLTETLWFASSSADAAPAVRYFRRNDSSTGKLSLWRLQDTGASVPLIDLPASSSGGIFAQAQGSALLVYGDGSAWLAEAGSTQARRVASWVPSSTYRGFVGARAGRAVVSLSDGLVALGPVQVERLSPACATPSCPSLAFAYQVGSRFVFAHSDGSLWSSTGSGAPLRLLAPCDSCRFDDVSTDPASGLLHFLASRGATYGYWTSDGTAAGTRAVTTESLPYGTRWVGARLVAVLSDFTEKTVTVVAHEAGKPPVSLIELAPIETGGSPSSLAAAAFGLIGALGGTTAFALAEGSYYHVALNIGAKPLRVASGAVVVNGGPYASSQTRRILAWEAPDLLVDLGPANASDAVPLGDGAAWVGNGELWSWDGDGSAASFSIGGPGVVGSTGQRIFLGDFDGLTVSDGTPGGTLGIRDGQWYQTKLVAHQSTAPGARALLANGSPGGLWTSDGTAGGTRVLQQRYRNDASARLPGAWLLFGARGLRSSDRNGASAVFRWTGDALLGVVRLEEQVIEAAPLGQRVLFVTATAAKGEELWVSDGTAAGTRILADVWPGPFGSRPRDLTPVPGGMVFSALRPDVGRELWFTNGTAAGTRLLGDVAPGPPSSQPADFAVLGDDLYYSAQSAATGRELFRSPLRGGTCGAPKRLRGEELR